MSRLMHKKPKPDVLEVVHHEIPDNAAAAGAAAIPEQRAATSVMSRVAYKEGGITWRRMARYVAVTEAVGLLAILVMGAIEGLDAFYPAYLAAILFGVAAFLLPRGTKASAVYTLVVSCVMLVLMGGLFFGWTGFLHPLSYFEMTFATMSTLVPIAGIVATIAVLRHHDGANAAKTTATVTAAVCALLLVTGVVGSLATTDATRLPGDITVAAHNFKFEQTAITAKSGNVAIYFENKDPFAHNVTIKGHGGSKDANGRNSIRHVFRNLAAGTYEFYCSIHPEDMKGTLTVT